ncbi:unnamed protein product, partial [Onchocerca ochengi]|uniref:Tub domain-containing protein n=1 Tax=Onchocerca ochengi TaxID=42157 RepID=A0A182ERQ8_ONCOC
MAQMGAARFEDARLRARQSSSATSGLLSFEQNESDRLRMLERRQQETDYQHQTRLRSHQLRDYRLAFRYNPADNYSLSPHVLIGTMSEVCPYFKALKFKGEAKGMFCAAGKIKLAQVEPSESLKTLFARYTAKLN